MALAFLGCTALPKLGMLKYSYSSTIPMSNSKQAFMERPYLSSISSLKELLDLCLPSGFQLNILAGPLRKKNCIVRWVTNAVIYISAKKQLLMFVCTKRDMIHIHKKMCLEMKIPRNNAERSHWNQFHNTASVQYFWRQAALNQISVCIHLGHDRGR